MSTITIRNLPEDLVARIQAAAKERQHSMEQELRDLLGTVYRDRRRLAARIDERVRNQARPTTPEEIDAWKRYGRP